MTPGTASMNNYGYIFYMNPSAVSYKEIRYWLSVGLATAAGYGLILFLLLSGRHTDQETLPVASPQAMPFEVTLAQVNNVSQVTNTPAKILPPEVQSPVPAPQMTAEKVNIKQATVRVAPPEKRYRQNISPYRNRKENHLLLPRTAEQSVKNNLH